MNLFVYNALCLNLERSAKARQMTGELLEHLIRRGVMTLQQYVDGLKELLALADDMVIDVPMIWQYYAELVSPMVQDSSDDLAAPTGTSSGTAVSLTFLRDACLPLRDCSGADKAGLVVGLVIKDAVHRLVSGRTYLLGTGAVWLLVGPFYPRPGCLQQANVVSVVFFGLDLTLLCSVQLILASQL